MPQQELRQTVSQKVFPLVEIANRDLAIAWMLRGWDGSFALNVDGEYVFIVASGGQAKVLSKPPQTVGVRFTLTERTLDLLIAGRLSPLIAKLSGRLGSTGPTAEILRFAAVFTACLQRARHGSGNGL